MVVAGKDVLYVCYLGRLIRRLLRRKKDVEYGGRASLKGNWRLKGEDGDVIEGEFLDRHGLEGWSQRLNVQ